MPLPIVQLSGRAVVFPRSLVHIILRTLFSLSHYKMFYTELSDLDCETVRQCSRMRLASESIPCVAFWSTSLVTGDEAALLGTPIKELMLLSLDLTRNAQCLVLLHTIFY